GGGRKRGQREALEGQRSIPFRPGGWDIYFPVAFIYILFARLPALCTASEHFINETHAAAVVVLALAALSRPKRVDVPLTRGKERSEMVSVLSSRWGLEPVVVGAPVGGDERSPLHAGDTSSTAAAAAAAAQSSDSTDEQEDDDEPTGRALWDCAQVLWDLVADPRSGNDFSVRGKHVIELGGGTGALSVGLARAGAASVTCTDLPCHLARIRSTVRHNFQITESAEVCSHGFSSSSGSGSGGRVNIGGCGEGGDGNSVEAGVPTLGRQPAATAVAAAVVPAGPAREARVCVAALRWGDEEDLARVRATPDSEESDGGGNGEGGELTSPHGNPGNGSSRGSSSAVERKAPRGSDDTNSSSSSSTTTTRSGNKSCNHHTSSQNSGVGKHTTMATTAPESGEGAEATVPGSSAAAGALGAAAAAEAAAAQLIGGVQALESGRPGGRR
ncbi:unnamed protein product, partial [Scytosiphon promiscuus]